MMRVQKFANFSMRLSDNLMEKIKSYVPILRWRPAEMSAFEKLYNQDKECITPFIEFIMPAPTTDKKNYRKVLEDSKSKFLRKMPEISEQLLKHCGKTSVFIDVHLLDGDIRATSFEKILLSSSELGITPIPVIYVVPQISTDSDMSTRDAAVKFSKIDNKGLCIRIDVAHFDDIKLSDYIIEFMKKNELQFENTDILVDLQVINNETSLDSVIEKLSLIPEISRWRNFIISGGAFPKDLSGFHKHGHYELERLDWILWKNITDSKKIKRDIIFSDYTIQHPIHRILGPGLNISASIRYTNDEKWEIMRGEGLRNEKGAGYQQYPAHAKLIVQQPFYKGDDFSYGDRYIADRALSDNKKSGNPTTWLTAGINHHLTLVARQTSNLL